MIVTIHQPEHLPWLGFLNKIIQADLFVILDNVQFRKNYYQNRNKVRTANGWTWVKVPVRHKSDSLIKDVTITPDARWKKKWWDTIYYSYKKSNYFDIYAGSIETAINQDWQFLSDLNIYLIKMLFSFLDKKLACIKASELGIEGRGSEMLLKICKKAGATTYLSGISGRDYLEEDMFREENINIVYQEFYHPIYNQMYEPFEPCMSVIDLFFNYGPQSLEIIMCKNIQLMDKLFL